MSRYAPLLEAKKRNGGRNNQGRITTRHKGGGHRQHYRVIDFKRDKDGIAGQVERIEYDPNRSAHIALVLYADGERRYILAAKGLEAGTLCCRASMRRSSRAVPCRCATSRSVPRFMHRAEAG